MKLLILSYILPLMTFDSGYLFNPKFPIKHGINKPTTVVVWHENRIVFSTKNKINVVKCDWDHVEITCHFKEEINKNHKIRIMIHNGNIAI